MKLSRGVKATQLYVSYKSASAELHIYPLSDVNLARIYNLNSNKPGKGHATKVMEKILKIVDEHNLTLELTANQFDEKTFKNNKALAKWYAKFGLKKDKDQPINLIRKQKKKVLK